MCYLPLRTDLSCVQGNQAWSIHTRIFPLFCNELFHKPCRTVIHLSALRQTCLVISILILFFTQTIGVFEHESTRRNWKREDLNDVDDHERVSLSMITPHAWCMSRYPPWGCDENALRPHWTDSNAQKNYKTFIITRQTEYDCWWKLADSLSVSSLSKDEGFRRTTNGILKDLSLEQGITCFIRRRLDACRWSSRVCVGRITIGLKNNFVFGDRSKFVQEDLSVVRLSNEPRGIRMYRTILDRVAIDRIQSIWFAPWQTKKIFVGGENSNVIRTLSDVAGQTEQDGQEKDDRRPRDHREGRIVYWNWKRSDIEWVRRENKQAANGSVVRSSEESVPGDFLLSVRSFLTDSKGNALWQKKEKKKYDLDHDRLFGSERERNILSIRWHCPPFWLCVCVWMASGRRLEVRKRTRARRREKNDENAADRWSSDCHLSFHVLLNNTSKINRHARASN